ncbi:MAG: hypothetical protein M3Q56_08385 [Bacteroidota bacterium]|nr:hypothetical protein [Bacteroidota bacterium]
MTGFEFQHQIFNAIEKLHGRWNWKEHAATVLHISLGALYKKLRGDSHLHLDELILLKEHYKLSLDSFLQSDVQTIIFSKPNNLVSPITHVDYLNRIKDELTKIANLDQVTIYIITNEIPFYLLMQDPVLAFFKLLILMGTDLETSQSNPFEYNLQELLKDTQAKLKLKESADLYLQIPSTEIWSQTILDHMLYQIRYYIESKQLKDEQLISALFKALKNLVKRIDMLLEDGNKNLAMHPSSNINFNLYVHEFYQLNPCMIVQSNKGEMDCQYHDFANDLMTSNQYFNKHVLYTIKKLIKRSQKLSGESEKHRVEFINRLFEKINNTEREIE